MENNGHSLLTYVQTLLQKHEQEGAPRENELILLPGGSDRKFYRLKGEKELIIMIAPTAEEVTEYKDVQEHLLRHGVAVPEIYAVNVDKGIVIMEDVGTRSLCRIFNETTKGEAIDLLYRNVLEALIHLQISGAEDIEGCKTVYEREFDYDVLRWESDYFREAFLEGLCGCPREETGRLEEDFQKLATLLADEPLYFMHRDFQSTNIFLKDERIRIIDFQSAHRGMLSYDLAALLRDAYVDLSGETREALFLRYHGLLQERTNIYPNRNDFRRVYVLSAIQRNMQALGAFSFLSRAKKKRWFLKSIPRALSYLKEGLDEAGIFRALQRAVSSERIEACLQSMSS